MTETPGPLGTGAVTEEKPKPFERLVGVLVTPTQTFEAIARRPDVLIPLLIILAITFLCSVITAQRLDYNELAREAMESAPRSGSQPMSEKQIEQGARFTAAFMKMASYASPVFLLIIFAVSSGIALIAYRLMGGEGDYKQAFAITTYAWMPRLVKGILATVVLVAKDSPTMVDLQNPLRSNLAFLFDPMAQPVQYALAMSIDAFSIWAVILLIIGFSAVSKLSRGKSAAIMITLWIFWTLITLIGPAFQAMRLER